jgi:hypothetical protein
LAIDEEPKEEGIPPDHVAEECALAGEPEEYLIPGFDWNTHASQTVCPALTETGLLRLTVCHPEEDFTAVVGVMPNLDPGAPEASAYMPSNILPPPPLWYMEMLCMVPLSENVA